jgi:hypothetical protein
MVVMERPNKSPITGTPCEHCDGWLVVYASVRKGGNVAVRYFHCFRCKRTADETETVVLPQRRNRNALLGQSKPDFD